MRQRRPRFFSAAMRAYPTRQLIHSKLGHAHSSRSACKFYRAHLFHRELKERAGKTETINKRSSHF
ncbi:hypothetical protein ASE07_07925 [Noviherbaspirillum sp. Root189]|nr:hypothetical protein ASE07_07925 [Noviherbaspirillum sp. Root189]